MAVAIRPLRQGEILDRAVRLYRRNFLQFVGIVALVQTPVTLVQILISLTTFSGSFERLSAALENPAAAPDGPFTVFGPAYFVGAGLSSAVGLAGFILIQGVATTALTAAVFDSYFGRPTLSILGAYRRVRDKWLPVVGALLLALMLALALGFWWLIPCFGWLTGGGMLVFLWYVVVPMLAPIIIMENTSPTTAWRRAWTLARRRFWWVLGFAVVLYIFNLLVVAGPAALVTLGGQFLGGSPLNLAGENFAIQTVVQSVTVLITGVFYLPVQVASMSLLYLDLRMRTEGLDLTLMAGSLVGASSGVEGDFAGVDANNDEPLMRTRDWRNFAFLTVSVVFGFLVLYAILIALIFAIVAILGPG